MSKILTTTKMATRLNKGPRPYDIEDWKNKADANRKRAEYWEKEHAK